MNSDFISQLATYFQTRGLGTVGTDIFIGVLPLETENAIYLLASPSSPPHLYVDTLHYTVDVWARYNAYEDGREILQRVMNTFHRRANYDLTDFHIYFSHMVGNIEDMDRDPESGKLLKIGLNFIYRNSNEVS